MVDFLSGGKQTTINSTITELFPTLAFNNKVKLTDYKGMHKLAVSLGDGQLLSDNKSKKSFVNNGDIKAAYDFIDDTYKIRPNMLQEKLSNAVGILNYLYEVNRVRPIDKVVWGYRAKPVGVPSGHAGDIFIFFQKGSPKISGISLKAGTVKSAEPKMNSYVRTTLQKSMWKAQSRQRLSHLKEI